MRHGDNFLIESNIEIVSAQNAVLYHIARSFGERFIAGVGELVASKRAF